MIRNNLPYQKMVLVCTHEREPHKRVCCRRNGGDALREKLKAMVTARGLKPHIRVSASGCLDKCEEGANLLILPDNVWYSHVEEKDLDAILAALEADIKTGHDETDHAV